MIEAFVTDPTLLAIAMLSGASVSACMTAVFIDGEHLIPFLTIAVISMIPAIALGSSDAYRIVTWSFPTLFIWFGLHCMIRTTLMSWAFSRRSPARSGTPAAARISSSKRS
jgi:hypothetical protein